MPTVLFFRPDEDLAMTFVADWLSLGVDYAVNLGYDVVDLYSGDATRENLEKAISQYKPEILILGGHGGARVFTGFNQQVVLEACVNDDIIKDTVSHFVSCYVGMELLPSAIEKTAIWTVGYQTTFDFQIDPPEAVEPFRDITLAIIAKVLGGGALREVWEAGIAKGQEWIVKLWNRRELWCAEVIGLIEHDLDGMIGLGREEACVLPPRVRWPVKLTAPQAIGLGLLFLFLLTK